MSENRHLPPRSTVWGYIAIGNADGTMDFDCGQVDAFETEAEAIAKLREEATDRDNGGAEGVVYKMVPIAIAERGRMQIKRLK